MPPINPDIKQVANTPPVPADSAAPIAKKPIWTDEVDEAFEFSDLPPGQGKGKPNVTNSGG